MGVVAVVMTVGRIKVHRVDTMYAVDQFVTVNGPKTENQQIATGKQPINGQYFLVPPPEKYRSEKRRR